jgi:hypothetical protein
LNFRVAAQNKDGKKQKKVPPNKKNHDARKFFAPIFLNAKLLPNESLQKNPQ